MQRLFGCNRSAAPPADSLPSGGTEPSAHCRFGLDAVVFADAYETPAPDEEQPSEPVLTLRMLSEERACPHTTYVGSSARNPVIGRMTPKN